MNNKRIEMARKMKEADARQATAVGETADLVKDGLLIREEAATCIAGAVCKAIDELELNPAGKETGGSVQYCRLLLDQELEGSDAKLKIGVHV